MTNDIKERITSLSIVDNFYFYNVLTLLYEPSQYKQTFQKIRALILDTFQSLRVPCEDRACYEHYLVCQLEISLSSKLDKFDEHDFNNANLGVSFEGFRKMKKYCNQYDLACFFVMTEKRLGEKYEFFCDVRQNFFSKVDSIYFKPYEFMQLTNKYFSFCYKYSSTEIYRYFRDMEILETSKKDRKKIDNNANVDSEKDFFVRAFLMLEFEIFRKEMIKARPLGEFGVAYTNEIKLFGELIEKGIVHEDFSLKEVIDFLPDMGKEKCRFSLFEFENLKDKNKVIEFLQSYKTTIRTNPHFIKGIGACIGYIGALYVAEKTLNNNDGELIESIYEDVHTFLREKKEMVISGKTLGTRYREIKRDERYKAVEFYLSQHESVSQIRQNFRNYAYDWRDDRSYRISINIKI